jgi:outer membrane protein, multidrug efflux system
VRDLQRVLLTAVLGCVAGCAVGPHYERPELAMPDRFSATDPGYADAQAVGEFWTLFQEPELDALIDQALEENKDLAIARANLRASRAARRLTGFDAYPTVTASTGAAHRLASKHAEPGVPRDVREDDDVDAGFDASWELDFFGRVRRDIEAARADERAAVERVRDAQVSVTAEVARNYFVLRGLQDQLAVADRNADNQRETLSITQARLDAGRGTELDTSRALAQLETTRASIPSIEASIATTIHRLSVLTGRPPNDLTNELAPVRIMPALPPVTDIGTPEALLRRRPDVRAAERDLAAATARIGVATADLFPRVTFFGTGGYEASSYGDLDNAGADFYSFGPRITWAAFDLGRVRARIEASEGRADAALATYEAAVLNALEDTENALVTYGRAQVRRDRLAAANAASQRAASLARQRYEGGLSDFLNVLEAERDALAAEDSLSRSRTDAATALVAIYKALGGGWIE